MPKNSIKNIFDAKEAINRLSEAKVYIIGDIMLDQYLWCTVERISKEAPVPIAKVSKKTHVLGGAANVAHNISSLGGKAILIGRIGVDEEGKIVEKILADKKIHCPILLKDKHVPTICKTRVVSGIHHLVRIDREECDALGSKDESKVINFIKKIGDKSIVIVSDYNKGMITDKIAEAISNLSKRHKIIVLVDPTPPTIKKIKFPFIVKPNREEAELIAKEIITPDFNNLLKVSNIIKKGTNAENVLITLGPGGMALSNKNGVERLPVYVRDVYDVSGAGDTTIGVLGASLSIGISLENSLILSSVAAGVVVEKLGTAVCTSKELIDFMKYHSLNEYINKQ